MDIWEPAQLHTLGFDEFLQAYWEAIDRNRVPSVEGLSWQPLCVRRSNATWTYSRVAGQVGYGPETGLWEETNRTHYTRADLSLSHSVGAFLGSRSGVLPVVDFGSRAPLNSQHP